MNGVRAVCFDAYGTLCRIRDPRRPYLRLFKGLGINLQSAARLAMTTGQTFEQLGAFLAPGASREMGELRIELEAELASVELFEEVPAVLARLGDWGLRRWVVSNLAPPYAEPLWRLLAGTVEGFSLSFQVGAVKPGPAIFAHACAGLRLPAAQVVMVGDNLEADVEGARSFGMTAVWLSRGAPSSWPERIGSLQELAARLTDRSA